MSDKQRRIWRAFHAEADRRHLTWEKTGYDHRHRPQPVPYPDELVGMVCEAKTRKGTPCKSKALWINGRCRLHGGLSTGPTTQEGKRKAAENGKCPKGKRTP